MTDKKYTVHIVDDEERHRKHYTRFFTRQGHHTITSNDGLNALGVLKPLESAKLPDCIVLDVNMPRMDGFEFCRRIKDDQKYQHCRDIPVLMLTARTSDETRDKAFEYGVDMFLRKTEIRNAHSLIKPVENLCEKHQIRLQALDGFEELRERANVALRQARIHEKAQNMLLSCLELLPFPGNQPFALMIYQTLKKTYGVEGVVHIRITPEEHVFFTERSELFEDMVDTYLHQENGIYHGRGHTVIVGTKIVFLGVGFPEDEFKRQTLAEIIQQSLEQFEHYMKKKKESIGRS